MRVWNTINRSREVTSRGSWRERRDVDRSEQTLTRAPLLPLHPGHSHTLSPGRTRQLRRRCHHTWKAWPIEATHLSEEQTRATRQLLAEYADVFSSGDLDFGRTSLVKHAIYTRDSPPIKQPPLRVASAKREEMQRAVQEIAAAGLIERSDSPWFSLVVLVAKKDGKKRLCVDYRALNAVTVSEAYPPASNGRHVGRIGRSPMVLDVGP